MLSSRRPGLDYRTSRRGVGALNGWRATQLSGCVLWLRADLGVTTAEAAVLDPNDVSTGNWSAANLSNRTATTITDTNDLGVPTLHYVTQTTSGLQSTHTATLAVELKAGTKTWAWVACSFGVSAYLNLTTGALGTVTGGSAVVTDMGSGWWRIALTGVTDGNPIAVGPANGDGAVSYAGAGTGTVLMRAFDVDQVRASAVADQSGLADHFAQATAADQPALEQAAFNGRPAFRGDINATAGAPTDRLNRSAAGSVGSADTAATLFLATTRSESASSYLCSGITGNDNAVIHGFVAGTSEWYNAPDRYTIKAAAPTGLHIYTIRQTNGVALQGWYDGGAGFGPVVPAVAWKGMRYVGGYSSAGNAQNGSWTEAIQYNRALSDAERQTVERYLGARYGISVA